MARARGGAGASSAGEIEIASSRSGAPAAAISGDLAPISGDLAPISAISGQISPRTSRISAHISRREIAGSPFELRVLPGPCHLP